MLLGLFPGMGAETGFRVRRFVRNVRELGLPGLNPVLGQGSSRQRSVAVPSPVPGMGHFSQALKSHVCIAAKSLPVGAICRTGT